MANSNLRRWVHAALRHGDRLGGLATWFEHIITAAIIISVLSLVLDTEPALRARYGELFDWIEIITVSLFVIEYGARVWSIVERVRYRHPITGRLRFMFTPLMIIDALAIIPSLLPVLGVEFRVLRLIRLLRLLKFSRHNETTKMFLRVLRDRTPELLTASIAGFVIMLIASTLMYLVEGEHQPEAFGSIPRSMWWAVVTLTTVGYGDVTPITPMGRMVVAVTAALGIGVIAVPTALLGSGLTEAMAEDRRRKRRARQRLANLTSNTNQSTNK